MTKKKVEENWTSIFRYASNTDIKHFSFDFWNTIAFSNPKFKQVRTEYISNLLNNEVGLISIDAAFHKIGLEYNLIQESGKNVISPIDLLEKVLIKLCPSVSHIDFQVLKREIDKLFIDFPPFLDENFKRFLDYILATGKTCSITSNTAFIAGKEIKQFLSNENLLKKISFCNFSDEVGYAKPSKKIYKHVYLNAKSLHSSLKVSEIIHIGDNKTTDYDGASFFGFRSILFYKNVDLLNAKHALHTISDVDAVPFSEIEYSKFKFGDNLIAKKYGVELFEYFQKFILPDIITKNCNFLIFSSPYDQIPTSSYYLTKSFYDEFCIYVNEKGIKSKFIKFCKIIRCQTYTEDYGKLNAEERFNLIKDDTYEFVNIPSQNDVSIFIDDISITGTHQRVVEKLLNDCSIKTNCIFLYYSKLSNPEVCPTFENELNYFFIKDITMLTNLILSDSFKITTRATKYILSLQKKDIEYLLSKIKLNGKYFIINEVVSMSYANKYDNIELYKENLKTMRQFFLELKTEATNF